ncbi:hypothetical protein GCM10012320_35320 [Sinomonas cellulolyticus]|uniref:DUF3841 domain-containing protein n=1 Tax=Sinomonas cellulolyticus TaxID=2801916 RepID=A0ABS1K0F5_9MICC|nr:MULTISPECIES: DUF3841 domain-containing protein [Sinomonas]MBL0705095.1 DUF3841 domain-containing protein [Sinomonas cellulolyticus]GHG60651.1 hypothetical protein GCM10012320_35320 [Sinomonas sp. KCTC 49339]
MAFPIRRCHVGEALPPGRMGYDLSAPVLLLHTRQTPEVLRQLLETGRFTPDRSHVDEWYHGPYDWMLRKMSERLPTRGEGAVWFWAKTRREYLLDEMRHCGRDVLLTCRIPRERVLLSEYHDWHNVLNASPNVFLLPGESRDEYGTRYDAMLAEIDARALTAGVADRLHWEWPPELRRDTEDTWDTILDPSNYGRRHLWQATAHELYAEDIVEAVVVDRTPRPATARRRASRQTLHRAHS